MAANIVAVVKYKMQLKMLQQKLQSPQTIFVLLQNFVLFCKFCVH